MSWFLLIHHLCRSLPSLESLSGLRAIGQPVLRTLSLWDFPGGPVVKNLPSNAGDAGSIPGQGTEIPHAVGQLSLRVATREPMCRKLQSP